MKHKLYFIAWIIAFGSFQAAATNAQWIQANPSGGTITTLAVSGSTLFEGAAEGTYRSTDNGRSCTDISAGLTGYVTSFAVNDAKLFAGTFGNGVFHSTDNGSSWTPASKGLTNNNVWALAEMGRNLFAATGGGGVFRSIDNGTNWMPVNGGLGNDTIHALTASGNNLFAGTFNGIFLSTDSGVSWKAVNNGLTSTPVLCFATIGTNIFAGTTDGIYLTTNSGESWTHPDTGLTSSEVTSFAVLGANIFAGTSDGIFLSFNNGANWIPVNTGLTDPYVDALAVSDTNTSSPKLFVGTNSGGGVYISTDLGEEWTVANTGPRTANDDVNTLAVIGDNLFAGTWFYGSGKDYFDIYRSADDGASWENASNGLTGNYQYIDAIVASDPIVSTPMLFVGTYNNGVFRSSDNGTSWTSASIGLTNNYVLALVVSGSNLFAGTWGGVFLSTDNGTSWSIANNGLTSSTIVSTFALSDTNTSSPILFAGTQDVSGEIYRSSDRGRSWQSANTGVANGNINAFVSIGGNLFVATDSGVFVTTNNGTSWSVANNGLPKAAILDLAESGTNLFAAGTEGVFLSTNNGTSWTSVSSGLPNDLTFNSQFVGRLAVKGSNLFAGTSAGVWRRPLSEMLGSNAIAIEPQSEQLIGAYPNPCFGRTTITFSCAEPGSAEVTVVNLLGAQITKIFDGALDGGVHSFTWGASNTVPGTYFFVIKNGSHITRRPIVVE